MGRGGRELYPVRVFICVWNYAAKDQARPTTSTASGPDDKARTVSSGQLNVSVCKNAELEVQRLAKRGGRPHTWGLGRLHGQGRPPGIEWPLARREMMEPDMLC